MARLRGVFNWVPGRCISNIPLKMPFPCKSYPGRLAALLSQSRNAAIMPTMGDHLPAQQPSCFPTSPALILEAALSSKSAPDRQTQAAGFENWKVKASGVRKAKSHLELLFLGWSVQICRVSLQKPCSLFLSPALMSASHAACIHSKQQQTP